MSTVDVASLLSEATAEELAAEQLALLEDAGFEVTSWDEKDPARVLVSVDVESLVRLARLLTKVTKGGYLGTAEREWLTALATNYDEKRAESTFCERTIVLGDDGGAPHTFAAEDIVAQTADGRTFRSIDGGTLTVGGTLTITLRAESPGTGYAGAAGTWSLVTSYPGITVSDGTVTKPGTDEQGDEALRAASRARLSRLGAGANDDAYEYLATHTPDVGALVTRCTVLRHTPAPGQVTILVAGPAASGPDGADALDAALVTKIQDYIDPADHKGKAPNVVDVFVEAAKYKRVAVSGAVVAVTTERASGEAAGLAALNAWAAGFRIGAPKVSREKLIAKLLSGLSDDDRNDATLTSPAGDTSLAYNEVPYFDTLGLTWSDA